MKICLLYIEEYGALRDKRIELSDGLNLIQGENESGKSTVCAFIKFIFYGHADSRERELRASITSGISAGYMLFEHSDGKLYRIDRRESDGRAKVSVFCESDGESLKKLPVSIGEYFLGIPEKLYTRSVFISQKNTPELDKQSSEAVSNLLTGGSEAMNVKRAEKQLDEFRKEYRHLRGRAGLIPDTEDELERVRARFREAVNKKLRLEGVNSEIRDALAERELLEKSVLGDSQSRSFENTAPSREDIFKLSELSREIEFSGKNVSSLELLTKSRPTEPKGFEFYKNNPDENALEQTACRMHSVKRKFSIISFTTLITAFICFGFSGFSVLFIALGCGLAVFGVFSMFTAFHRSKAFSEFLVEIDCRDETEISAFYARCKSYSETVDAFNEHKRMAESARTELKEKKTELDKMLARFEVESIAEAMQKLNAAGEKRRSFAEKSEALNARLQELYIERARLEGESLEDAGELSALDNELCGRLSEYEKSFDAAKLALDALDAAQRSVRQTFIPKISSVGEGYFERLTGGKYRSLMLDSEFEVSCRQGDGLPLSEEHLSGGSHALAWFCLRLALVGRLSDGKLPLILDEPFVYFDEKRLASALGLLSEIAESGAQIILFSASDREDRMLCKGKFFSKNLTFNS